MKFSHVIIIYNPNSTGPSQAMAETLAAKLAPLNVPVELQATQRRGHAGELAEAAARQHDQPLVISSSGDGGYHEVINGLMAAAADGHLAVAAVLPAGNANDHARSIARSPLAEAIMAGQTSQLDLLQAKFTAPDGQVVTRYAHSYIGLGLTPIVATELNRHTLNAFRELLIVVRTFYQLRPVMIRQAGRTLAVDSLILSNIRHMAKALTVSHHGRPTDGQFEITLFPAGAKLRLLARLLKAAVIGLHAQQRADRYELTVIKDTPIQLDGEVLPLAAGTEVAVTIIPGALTTVR